MKKVQSYNEKQYMLHRGELVTVKQGVFAFGTIAPKVGYPYEYYKTYVDKGNQVSIIIDLDTQQEYHIPVRFIQEV